jgi:hypothetical protein
MSAVVRSAGLGESRSDADPPRPPEPGALESLERELKYAVPAGRVAAVRHWLQAACRPDARFPEAVVWTVYYDTPDLRSLDEKRNSDYLKTKVRVRWYSDLQGVAEGPVFLEMKGRVGSRREKTRVSLPWPAAELAGRSLADPIYRDLPIRLREQGVLADASWQPIVQVRYRRLRLVEPVSGARVSLDDDIAVSAVNPRCVSALNLGPVPVAVLEVKGDTDVLPPRLHPVTQLGARKTSFSKYAAAFQHVRRVIS